MLQIIIISNDERLTIERKEKPVKPVIVKGHFRVINGKRVYVKPHLRKR